MKIYFINKDPQNMFNTRTGVFDNQFKGNYKLNVQQLSNTLCTQIVVFCVHGRYEFNVISFTQRSNKL